MDYSKQIIKIANLKYDGDFNEAYKDPDIISLVREMKNSSKKQDYMDDYVETDNKPKRIHRPIKKSQIGDLINKNYTLSQIGRELGISEYRVISIIHINGWLIPNVYKYVATRNDKFYYSKSAGSLARFVDTPLNDMHRHYGSKVNGYLINKIQMNKINAQKGAVFLD